MTDDPGWVRHQYETTQRLAARAAGVTGHRLSFTRENGHAILARHFTRVEQRDLGTSASFASRESAAAYLASMDFPTAGLPTHGYPLQVRGAPTVFVCR